MTIRDCFIKFIVSDEFITVAVMVATWFAVRALLMIFDDK